MTPIEAIALVVASIALVIGVYLLLHAAVMDAAHQQILETMGHGRVNGRSISQRLDDLEMAADRLRVCVEALESDMPIPDGRESLADWFEAMARVVRAGSREGES